MRAEPPEPALPQLLALEIGAPPDRPRRRGSPWLLLLVGILVLVLGVATAGASVVRSGSTAPRPRVVLPSGKVAPGTPAVAVTEPAPPEPDPEPDPEPRRPRLRVAVAPSPDTPARLVVEGDATVELHGEFGGFRAGTPLPAGPYAVWADFGAGLAETSLRVTAAPGRPLTVICVTEHRMCALVP